VGFVIALQVELIVVWEVIREVALEALRVVLKIVYKLLISRR
jgi:hypothetical protein